MKIAVMSDIHGNYIALQRCLAHALEQNVDAYIFLGDYLGEFPYPQRTLEILYELKQNASCIFIRGNKEDYWLNRRKDQNCDWKSGNRSVMAMIYNYNSLNARSYSFCLHLNTAFSQYRKEHPSLRFYDTISQLVFHIYIGDCKL